MATNDQEAKTFSLKTPVDLYRKLRFEALELHNNPPGDLTVRSYAVLNAVTTAWQMKDWVYCSLKEAGQLNRLHDFAKSEIKGSKHFGKFLTANSPWMNMCFQLATAAKHFAVTDRDGLAEVATGVDFQFEPGSTAHDLAGQREIMISTENRSISGPDLILLLAFIWANALVDLGLLSRAEADLSS